MQFQLTISLDNAEATEDRASALAQYLAGVSDQAGYGLASGTVRDGNGNTIGAWTITDET